MIHLNLWVIIIFFFKFWKVFFLFEIKYGDLNRLDGVDSFLFQK